MHPECICKHNETKRATKEKLKSNWGDIENQRNINWISNLPSPEIACSKLLLCTFPKVFPHIFQRWWHFSFVDCSLASRYIPCNKICLWQLRNAVGDLMGGSIKKLSVLFNDQQHYSTLSWKKIFTSQCAWLASVFKQQSEPSKSQCLMLW